MSRLRFFVPGVFLQVAFSCLGGLVGFAFNPSAYGKLVAPVKAYIARPE